MIWIYASYLGSVGNAKKMQLTDRRPFLWVCSRTTVSRRIGVGWKNGVVLRRQEVFSSPVPHHFLKSVLRRQEVFLSFSSKSVFVTGQLHGLLVRAGVWLCEEDQVSLRLQLTHPIRSHSGRDSTNLEFGPWTIINHIDTKAKCRHLKKIYL